MNTERLFNIVLTSLSSDLLILEQELERCINSDIDTDTKITQIKSLLNKIVLSESSITKFRNMITNNNNENTKKDGKI